MSEKKFSVEHQIDENGGYSEIGMMNNMIEMHEAGQLTQFRVNKWLSSLSDGKQDEMRRRLEQGLNCEIEELPEK